MKTEDLIRDLKDLSEWLSSHKDFPLSTGRFEMWQSVTPEVLVQAAKATGRRPVDTGYSYEIHVTYPTVNFMAFCRYERSTDVSKKTLDNLLASAV